MNCTFRQNLPTVSVDRLQRFLQTRRWYSLSKWLKLRETKHWHSGAIQTHWKVVTIKWRRTLQRQRASLVIEMSWKRRLTDWYRFLVKEEWRMNWRSGCKRGCLFCSKWQCGLMHKMAMSFDDRIESHYYTPNISRWYLMIMERVRFSLLWVSIYTLSGINIKQAKYLWSESIYRFTPILLTSLLAACVEIRDCEMSLSLPYLPYQ